MSKASLRSGLKPGAWAGDNTIRQDSQGRALIESWALRPLGLSWLLMQPLKFRCFGRRDGVRLHAPMLQASEKGRGAESREVGRRAAVAMRI